MSPDRPRVTYESRERVRQAGGVSIEFDVPARMRDGTALRANVYRPAGHGPWPVLVMRLPYGKDSFVEMEWLDPARAARAGFIVVVQDVRGRFASDGQWCPFIHERSDGFDTVEWAAGLPGANGMVGLFGLSYHGNTQWLAAFSKPPSLRAIAPGMTWADPRDGLFSRGGAVELGLLLPWYLQLGMGGTADLPQPTSAELSALFDEYDALVENGYWDLPVSARKPLRRHGLDDRGALDGRANSELVEAANVAGLQATVTVPAFHVAGWHDLFLQGTLDSFSAMSTAGVSTRLVVGPWTHLDFTDPIGDLGYGIRAARMGVPSHAGSDLVDLQLDWFRRELEVGGEREEQDAPPVRAFVMGRNEWRDEPAWPPRRAVAERWYLTSAGRLDLAAPPIDADASTFTYDPGFPVETVGGNTLLARARPAGPIDQRGIEARPDVCVFTSAVLDRELEVAGRVRLVLHAESSAVATDWVGRLCDVHPDGRSVGLCDGILRLQGGANACRRVEIDLWSTWNVFLPGHRLRVHVTSSSFPRWDRNLNTGDQHAARYEVAHQRVFHTEERPSYVELPCIGP